MSGRLVFVAVSALVVVGLAILPAFVTTGSPPLGSVSKVSEQGTNGAASPSDHGLQLAPKKCLVDPTAQGCARPK